jgi:hypothetical protein
MKIDVGGSSTSKLRLKLRHRRGRQVRVKGGEMKKSIDVEGTFESTDFPNLTPLM